MSQKISKALVHQNMSMQEQIEYCKFLSDADLLPSSYRRKPGNIMLAMEMGKVWGLTAIQTITQVHVIDSKPTASANLMSGLVVAAGHKFEVLQQSDKVAHTRITRREGTVFESRWDMERAKVAELAGRKIWKNYPQAMLLARATSEVCRQACPDVLCGLIYTPEELGAPVNEDGEILEGEIVATSTTPPIAENTRIVDLKPKRLETIAPLLKAAGAKSSDDARALLEESGLRCAEDDYRVNSEGRVMWDSLTDEAFANLCKWLSSRPVKSEPAPVESNPEPDPQPEPEAATIAPSSAEEAQRHLRTVCIQMGAKSAKAALGLLATWGVPVKATEDGKVDWASIDLEGLKNVPPHIWRGEVDNAK